jgi:peroxiredoxin
MTCRLTNLSRPSRRLAPALVASIAMAFSASPQARGAKSDEIIGRHVNNFTLRDYRGADRSLDEFSEAKLVVVAFLGSECPLANLYGSRLSQLQDEYQDKAVQVIGINSNRQDSVADVKEYAERQTIEFPLLKDPANKIADAFGAERTPQVFVLDQSRTIRYSGAIDDQYGVGVQRRKANQRYLAEAIDNLLADKPVATPTTVSAGCLIGRHRESPPTGEVTYSKDIAPIFNRHCVECHREGEMAPFSLLSYDDVLGWEDTIVEVISAGRMPPWFADPQHGEFKNDARLSESDKELIRQWVKYGSPKGDEADLPEPPTFAEGWRIQNPDQVVKMDDKPFNVPSEGVVDYQHFIVDPDWKEDKYVIAAEARPGNRAVVHHIIAYLVPPGSDPRKDRSRMMLVGYAPGSPPNVMANGLAIHVPAGSKLLFELHYTPNGVEQTDLSYVGFQFTDRDSVKKFVEGRAVVNEDFAIPPGAKDHEVVADYRSRRDELLLKMVPHMHLRGKSFRFEAVYPDKRREVLLNVPAYDFNWQLNYILAEPKLLPKGTKIVCTAHFDNSAENPANPDPSAEVRWGEQSWDEMMIGFLDVVAAEEKVSLSAKDH